MDLIPYLLSPGFLSYSLKTIRYYLLFMWKDNLYVLKNNIP